MIALWVAALFPLLLGLGFSAAFALFAWRSGDKERAGRAMRRHNLLVYAVLLSAPLVLALVDGARAGLLHDMGLGLPRLGALHAAPAALLSVLFGVVIGALVYYGELALSIGIHAWLRRHGRVDEIVAGKSRSFAESLPPFGRYLVMAAYVSFAEELVWRGYLPLALGHALAIRALPAVLLAALLFGANHFYYGPRSALLKALDGLAWSALFALTGSLVAPFVSHLTFQLLAYRRACARERQTWQRP
jgi:uncharacterized protein